MVVLGGINMNGNVLNQLAILDLEKKKWNNMSAVSNYSSPF